MQEYRQQYRKQSKRGNAKQKFAQLDSKFKVEDDLKSITQDIHFELDVQKSLDSIVGSSDISFLRSKKLSTSRKKDFVCIFEDENEPRRKWEDSLRSPFRNSVARLTTKVDDKRNTLLRNNDDSSICSVNTKSTSCEYDMTNAEIVGVSDILEESNKPTFSSQKSLNQASDSVTLSTSELNKYFGIEAVHHFHATYREISGRSNLFTGGVDELLVSLTQSDAISTTSDSPTNVPSSLSVGTWDNSSYISQNFSLKSCSSRDSFTSSVKKLRKYGVLPPLEDTNTLSSIVEDESKQSGSSHKIKFTVAPRKARNLGHFGKKSLLRYGDASVNQISNKTENMQIKDEVSLLSELTPGCSMDSLQNATSPCMDDDVSVLSSLEGNSLYDSEQYDFEDENTFDGKDDHVDLRLPTDKLRSFDDDIYRDPETFSTYGPESPRAIFLAGCLKFKLPPRSLAMLRQRFTTVINLENHGLSDEFGTIFALAFANMPAVQVLNMADNNLTDISLAPLMDAIKKSGKLRELNISSNFVGPHCAASLSEYLLQRSCLLEYLMLSRAHICDKVCTLITSSLANNRILKVLDLSYNFLGRDDSSHALVKGEKEITPGESIGALLRNPLCVLEVLKLNWNFLKGYSALDLCQSVSECSSLVHLDLSFNGIGSDGGMLLGTALINNKSLRNLNVANNNIGPEACFCLCVGCKESNLHYFNIDGNPIGEEGGRMLMSIPLVQGSRLKFSAKGCDVVTKSRLKMVNILDPVGTYDLSMSSPFGRAILMQLLDIIATNPYFGITKFLVSKGEGKSRPGTQNPKTIPANSPDWDKVTVKIFDEKNPHAKESTDLRHQLETQAALSQDLSKVDKMFRKMTKKSNLFMDQTEFSNLLHELGIKAGKRDVISIIRSFENDGKDTITRENVQRYIKEVADYANTQVHGILFRSRCSCTTEKKRADTAGSPEARTGSFSRAKGSNISLDSFPAGLLEKYVPPTTGRVIIEISRNYLLPFEPRAISIAQIRHLYHAATASQNVGILFSYGLEMITCHVAEGDSVVQILKKECGDVIIALSKVLPRMYNHTEAARLERLYIGNSYVKRHMLRSILGNAYAPILGHYDGFYSLNLCVESDRICMAKLLERNAVIESLRKGKCLGDVSQNGDWTCFRNQYLDDDLKYGPAITAEFNSNLPEEVTETDDESEQSSDDSSVEEENEPETPKVEEEEIKEPEFTAVKIVDTRPAKLMSREMFSPMPLKGRLHFDFSGSEKPYYIRSDFPNPSSFVGKYYNYVDRRLNDIPLSDAKVVQLLKHASLISTPKVESASFKLLDEYRSACERSLAGYGYCYWTCDVERAEMIAEYLHSKFYANLHDRDRQFREANYVHLKPKTVLDSLKSFHLKNVPSSAAVQPPVQAEITPSKPLSLRESRFTQYSTAGGTNTLSKLIREKSAQAPQKSKSPARNIAIPELEDVEFVSSDEESYDAPTSTNKKRKKTTLKDESTDVQTPLLPIQSKWELLKNNHQKMNNFTDALLSMNTYLGSMKELLHVPHGRSSLESSHSRFGSLKRFESLGFGINLLGDVKSVPVYDFLCSQLSNAWVMCRHLALLLHLYDDGRAKHSDFGTYRVELIVSLFSRIVDLHNFDLVLMQLSTMEHACVMARIGVLNIFNPWKPDGAVCLDFARWDERQVAKIYIHLEVAEPGLNWIYFRLKQSWDTPYLRGWNLSPIWMKKDGIINTAVLTVKYTSGEGMRLRGACSPSRVLRTYLLSLVLIDPSYMVPEDVLRGRVTQTASFMDELLFEFRTVNDANASLKKLNIFWTYEGLPAPTDNLGKIILVR